MRSVTSLRRWSLTLLALCAFAAPVWAGPRMAQGEDANPHARASAKAESTAPSTSAMRAKHLSIPPADDNALCPPCAACPGTTGTNATAHPDLRSASARDGVPSAPERRGERRPRASATPVVRPHRPAPQRSKFGERNAPAMPGMGTLLRFGATSGREISWTDIRPRTAPSQLRAGRAPPRGPTSPTFARTARSSASPLAAISFRAPRHSHPRAGATPSNPHMHPPAFPHASLARGERACSFRPGTLARSASPERFARSRAGRPEAAAARTHPRLSGGPIS